MERYAALRRLQALMQEGAWGRPNRVETTGMEVLPSAQSQACRTCERREWKPCCEANCQLFRDLARARASGLAPGERGLIPEEEREAKADLLIDPCKWCTMRRRHLDIRIMQVIPVLCSGPVSRRYKEVAREIIRIMPK